MNFSLVIAATSWPSTFRKGCKALCCPGAPVPTTHKTMQELQTKATRSAALAAFSFLPEGRAGMTRSPRLFPVRVHERTQPWGTPRRDLSLYFFFQTSRLPTFAVGTVALPRGSLSRCHLSKARFWMPVSISRQFLHCFLYQLLGCLINREQYLQNQAAKKTNEQKNPTLYHSRIKKNQLLSTFWWQTIIIKLSGQWDASGHWKLWGWELCHYFFLHSFPW